MPEGQLTGRLAGPGDLVVVEALTQAAYAEYDAVLDGPPLPVTEAYGPRIAAGQVWLVSREGALVGLAVLETEADHVMIFNLAVAPGAQGGGVGRWMLAFAEAWARAAGKPEVRLYTNALMTRNIRVYGKAGYRETGRRAHPSRAGWTVVDMAKRVIP